MFLETQFLQPHVLAILLGLPRLLILCYLCPFLGGANVFGAVRVAIFLSLSIILYPCILDQVPDIDLHTAAGLLQVGGLMLKELLIGGMLAYLASIAFWVIEGAGLLIDNQRGCAQTADTNPFTGESTSPVGSLFSMSAIYVFYASGAFLAFLSAIYASYEFWPPCSFLPGDILTRPELAIFFGRKVATLATDIVLLAGPVVLSCLFIDMGLGIVNRFASQLQVYVLAMPVKSGMAFFLLLFYFGVIVNNASGMFESFHLDLQLLRKLIP